ncbi:PTS IIA-like nitrogen-regulatory protein PtsN [Geoalkalibacter ferrihydriticus]|uniref:PTS fructose transporter subunit IIA n=2 Tax=Geoalkalibacter ferrihydriticus TaxID=392333 RepID=A0A0C2DSZ3_9BACT|nr:PTS sugar transporter subunit IIA [Geoalkalibacter ferrihydriticus]KIH76574.1 PTS fructose transporter subunit IIA [Geoalkalibacter ferrihydriticus DSM 17813]SDM02088.1 PTS IIA-like nitrogen-regulatory protein PtsN [Geoalkalibacter ferrihydriticus]
MKISDLLKPDALVADLKATDKNALLEELTAALVRVEKGLDRSLVVDVLKERERLGSTGIGDGVAIPHGKLKNIDHLMLSFGRSLEGIDFDAMDGRPAHLFFLLIAPEDSVGIHLKTLARISKLLKTPQARERLMQATDAGDIYRIIVAEEANL